MTDAEEISTAEAVADYVLADGGDIGSDPVPFLYLFPPAVRFLALVMIERCPLHECDSAICADDDRTNCETYR